jgi:hypothetical protein
MEKSKRTVRLYLTVPPDFYQLVAKRAEQDYVKVATWTTQYLMRNLIVN